MSVKGDDTRSVNLLDLDYYSINEHITETDLYARIQNFSLGYLEPATLQSGHKKGQKWSICSVFSVCQPKKPPSAN